MLKVILRCNRALAYKIFDIFMPLYFTGNILCIELFNYTLSILLSLCSFHNYFLQICENGLISFEEQFCTPPPTNDPDPNAPPTIAGFWADISIGTNVFVVSYDEISFEETDPGREKQFNDSKVYVLNLLREGFGGSMEGFDPTHIFVVTWNKASINNTCVSYFTSIICYMQYVWCTQMHTHTYAQCNTFQIVLVSQKNYIKTYALLLYSSISWMSSSVQPPLVGFHKGVLK